MHLYKRVCPSVGWLVGRSFCQSVSRLVVPLRFHSDSPEMSKNGDNRLGNSPKLLGMVRIIQYTPPTPFQSPKLVEKSSKLSQNNQFRRLVVRTDLFVENKPIKPYCCTTTLRFCDIPIFHQTLKVPQGPRYCVSKIMESAHPINNFIVMWKPYKVGMRIRMRKGEEENRRMIMTMLASIISSTRCSSMHSCPASSNVGPLCR